jgi:hypothetical protein
VSYHTTDVVLVVIFVVVSLIAIIWYVFGPRPGETRRSWFKSDGQRQADTVVNRTVELRPTRVWPRGNDRNEGLHTNKFAVKRSDGSSEPGGKHEHCQYFVLDLDHDKFARPALKAYMQACCLEYPKLAKDLDRQLRDRLFGLVKENDEW